MKNTIKHVATCYDKRQKLLWYLHCPLTIIEEELSVWCTQPTETTDTISIRTYYKDTHLRPAGAMPSAVDIDLKKLSVIYQVALVANNKKYKNTKRTYSCLDDLLCSVLNYLATTQETTISGEN